MHIGLSIPVFQLCMILIASVSFCCTLSFGDLNVVPAAPPSETHEPPQSREQPKDDPIPPLTPPSQVKHGGVETLFQTPDDPCLQNEYNDWREFSLAEHHINSIALDRQIRLHIHRNSFILSLEVVEGDNPTMEIYFTTVGLGDLSSPTPVGSFVINHIYCYPDVVFFDSSSEKVSELYNGFFAPLLLCENRVGRCARYNDLGIHGFRASAIPGSSPIRPETYGAVTGGCIRLPDPCSFKKELIRNVGVGPVRKNERGSYHWLKRPVEVIIEGAYPGTDDDVTIADIVQDGLSHIRAGVRSMLELLGR
jgi:hypothetical protein